MSAPNKTLLSQPLAAGTAHCVARPKIWRYMYRAMKNLSKLIFLSVLLLVAQVGHSDSITLYEPSEIALSSKEAKKLGFKPSISKGLAADAEVSMVVELPNEIDGVPIRNVVARLFHKELSISTHSVLVGEGEGGKKQAWVNLNRAVVTRVELFFHGGYKKYVVSFDPKNI